MRHHKRFSPLAVIILAAAMILVIGLICTTYADSGKDGNITWNYDESTKTLTVGVVDKDASPYESLAYSYWGSPWNPYRDDIKIVNIEDGVRRITNHTFENYEKLEKVYLAESVTSLSELAFYFCTNLKLVSHPTGECYIEGGIDDMGYYYGPFDGCDSSWLTFAIPGDPDAISVLADWCKRHGFRIEGQKGSLRGASVKEYWEGEEPIEEEPTDGYSYFARKIWTGKAFKPVPVVELYGDELKYGTDFTCKWSTSKNVGRYECTIKGKGNYCDDTYSFYVIYPKGTSISKLTAGKKQLTVKWLKQSRKMSKKTISGYEVQVAENKAFTNGVESKYVNSYKKISTTFKNLKSKTYYVRVRTYRTANGCDIPSTWSPVKKIKVK